MSRRMAQAQDFDFYIGEYMYYCQSRKLRPKTLSSYEQTLRLFERWVQEQESITYPAEVKEQTIRHYICDLQERGKYTICVNDKQMEINHPTRRRDYREPVSVTTINNYIRNLRAFFNWYEEEPTAKGNPMKKIVQLKNERKAREYLENEELHKLLSNFDKSYFSECRDMTITTLLLDTGMRLGECLMLTTQSLDMAERVIELPADITKGKEEPLCVLFSQNRPFFVQLATV